MNFSVSHDGLLVYVPAGLVGQRDLDWVDREGGEENVVSLTGNMYGPRLSPDGRFVAFQRFLEDPSESNVWVYELARGALTRVTSGGGYDPVWTPDGMRVTFRRPVPDGGDIYWMPWDGSGEPEALVVRDGNQSPQSWSPDGETLAFQELNPEGNWDIWLLQPDGQETVTPFAVGQFDERWPAFSPDGGWIAYASNDAGQDEVYVRPQPGPGGRRTVSTGGGSEPIWSANGQELFYRNGPQVLAVPVETSPEFSAGTTEVLFGEPYLFSAGYDISQDGRRLLMLKRALGSQSTPALRVVLNFFEELQRLVPSP